MTRICREDKRLITAKNSLTRDDICQQFNVKTEGKKRSKTMVNSKTQDGTLSSNSQEFTEQTLFKQVDFLLALQHLCEKNMKDHHLNVMDILGAMRIQEARLANMVDKEFEKAYAEQEFRKEANYFG